MSKLRITIAPGFLHERHVLSLGFEKGYALIHKVKTDRGATWGQSRKFWWLHREEFKLSEVFNPLEGMPFLDYSGLKTEHIKSDKAHNLSDVYLRGRSYS